MTVPSPIQITRQKIYETKYWLEQCFGLTAELIVDRAVELRHERTPSLPHAHSLTCAEARTRARAAEARLKALSVLLSTIIYPLIPEQGRFVWVKGEKIADKGGCEAGPL